MSHCVSCRGSKCDGSLLCQTTTVPPFRGCPATALVGVAVAAGHAVGVAVATSLAVGVAVATGLAVGVAVAKGAAVGVAVAKSAAVGVAVGSSAAPQAPTAKESTTKRNKEAVIPLKILMSYLHLSNSC